MAHKAGKWIDRLDLRLVDWLDATTWIVRRRIVGDLVEIRRIYNLSDEHLAEEYSRLAGRTDIADELLIERIDDGRIRVFGRKKNEDKLSEIEQIPQSFLSINYSQEWDAGLLFFNEDEEYSDIWICFDDLSKEFPGNAKSLGELAQGPNDSEGFLDISNRDLPRRGRRPAYNWDAFWTELVLRADLDSLPESQAKCERMMLEWCENEWGKQPATSTVRSRLSPIYNHPKKKAEK